MDSAPQESNTEEADGKHIPQFPWRLFDPDGVPIEEALASGSLVVHGSGYHHGSTDSVNIYFTEEE